MPGKRMRLAVLAALLVIGSFFTLNAIVGARQEAPVVLWRDHTTISVVTDSLRPLYSTMRFLSHVRLSPTGERILVVEAEEDADRYRATVVDTSSSVVARFDDGSVLGAEWCCGGKVALHLGTFTSDGLAGGALALWNYSTGTTERPALGIGSVVDFAWHDGEQRLFVKLRAEGEGARVVSYDPATGVLTRTNLRGVHLSPDGKYYLDWDSENPIPSLYATSGGGELTPSLWHRAGIEGGRIEDWHPGAGHALIVRKLGDERAKVSEDGRRRELVRRTGEPSYAVVDAASGRTLREFTGKLWPRDRLAVGGAVAVETRGETPAAVFASP